MWHSMQVQITRFFITVRYISFSMHSYDRGVRFLSGTCDSSVLRIGKSFVQERDYASEDNHFRFKYFTSSILNSFCRNVLLHILGCCLGI